MACQFKLDIDRLLKVELEYELRIRGISEVGNVDSLRKCLRGALVLEKSGNTIHTSIKLDPETELNECDKKLLDIKESINSFTGSPTQIKKIETKFAHVFNRIDRISTTEEQLTLRRCRTLTSLIEFVSDYTSKLKTFESKTEEVSPDAINIAGASENNASLESNTSPDDAINIDNLNVNSIPSTSAYNFKSIPVYKWDFKFSGNQGFLSFNAFLQRVDDCCRSRNVNKQQLFNYASDLFEGDALKWYHFVGKNTNSWDELIQLMREQFAPSSDKLWRQIEKRTQGDEPIGIYIATMSSLFDRLPYSVPDVRRMEVLRKNITPFFQERLCSDIDKIKTPYELVEFCRRIERTKECIDEFVPPTPGNLTCEPDLDYKAPPRNKTLNSNKPVVQEVKAQVQKPKTCFRCGKPNHVARNCRTNLNIRCFSCNKPDVTKKTCPNCNQGNGQLRQ